ncbi:MAG: hypothetical protein AVDCRST_MAG19-660, partial [uncultured Thermomicrobiales bacterium]
WRSATPRATSSRRTTTAAPPPSAAARWRGSSAGHPASA